MVVPSGSPNGKGASAGASVFTLLNSAVGAGILSLPFAFRCAGWAGGLALTCVVALVEAFTLYVLTRYAEIAGAGTYSGLVRKMLGKKASAAMACVLLVYSLGSATAYMIILGDCFHPMLQQAFGVVWWTSRGSVIALFSSVLMLPLCFPTTLGAIAGVSSITLYSLCVVVGSVMYRAVQIVHGPDYAWADVQAFNASPQFFAAVPILVFGFQCHTNVVAVFKELEEEPSLFGSTTSLTSLAEQEAGAAGTGVADGTPPASGASTPRQGAAQPAAAPAPGRTLRLRHPPRAFVRPEGRSPKLLGMMQVVLAAIGITAAFYSLVGLFGYLAFPTSARSNILNSFSPDDRVIQVARAVVGLIEIVHYPVNHNPARQATLELLSQLTGRQLSGWKANVAETLTFYLVTLSLSLLVSDLGQVFKLIGGTCGAFFIFGIPGALLLQIAYSKHLQAREAAPLQQSLMEGAAAAASLERQGAAAAGEVAGYHYLTSKLWWAGVGLILLGLGLLTLTGYSIIHPLY